MWQRAFVLEYASKITAIDPTAARLAFDEVLGLVLRLRSEPSAEIFAAGEQTGGPAWSGPY
jgi:hypothetical protein